MSYSKTIAFTRGSEEWELEASFEVEGPDPSVGIFGSYCMLDSLEFFNPLAVWYGYDRVPPPDARFLSMKLPLEAQEDLLQRTINPPLIGPIRKTGRWQPFAISAAEREAIETRESEDYEPDFGPDDEW